MMFSWIMNELCFYKMQKIVLKFMVLQTQGRMLLVLLKNIASFRHTGQHGVRDRSNEGVFSGISDDYLCSVKGGDGGEKRVCHGWNVETIHCPLCDDRPLPSTWDLWMTWWRIQALDPLFPDEGRIIQINPMIQTTKHSHKWLACSIWTSASLRESFE